jgi:hypothetical protein
LNDKSRRLRTRAARGRRALVLVLCLQAFCLTSEAIAGETDAAGAAESSGVVHQLRIYEIFDDTKSAFHERFRDHAMRIMARYDFKIVATWETRTAEATQFVYLIEWPDEATMKDRWARFMADKEWADIKKATGARHGRLVGEIEDRTLKLTPYSPRQTLAK